MRSQRARMSSTSGSIMLLLSCLATLYVAGRLWQDSRFREEMLIHSRGTVAPPPSKPLSVEESFMKAEMRELERRASTLELLLAEAHMKGFVSDAAGAFAASTAKASSNSSTQTLNGSAAAVAGLQHPQHKGGLLAVIGISSSFGGRARRDAIRSTWMPKGEELRRLEQEKGIVVRFFVGRSPNSGDMLDRAIAEENAETQDILVMEDHEEADDNKPHKLKTFMAHAVHLWDADFYFKTEDSLYISLDNLVAYCRSLMDQPRAYIGCMKSGEVVSEKDKAWFEPEWLKFGDGKSYYRHSTGQFVGLTRPLALYVAINRALLHEYKHEDISLGSWMLGLDAAYVDNRRLCCGGQTECANQKKQGTPCVAVTEWTCNGLCNPDKSLPLIHQQCV